MDINESYKLAVKLGYDHGSVCHVVPREKEEETFWWNGLQIPREHVTIATTDPTSSGRYPWYLEMMKRKGL